MQPFQIGFFHLVICIEVSSMSSHCLIAHFLLVWNSIPLCAWTSLLIHSPTEGYLGCFQVFAIMNKVAMNTCVQVFVGTKVFTSFESIWKSLKAGSCGRSMFHFVRNCQTVFPSTAPFCLFASNEESPVAPRPCQYLELPVFRILAILLGV